MYQPGTASDYHDLLEQLIQVATSDSLSSVAVNSGGTGYVVDDILTITNTGATFTHEVKLRVLAVGGSGDITSLRIEEGGAYTADPSTTTGNALVGGTGSGGTADLTFDATGWTVKRRSRKAVSATVASGGSGYSVNDVLTLLVEDALGQTTAARFTVTAVSGSAVSTVSLLTAGLYEKEHSSPTDITTSVAPAGGTGATLNVTFGNATAQDERVVILEGNSTPLPLVGIRVYTGAGATTATTIRNWSLNGFTGFNNGLVYSQQPGISPGDSRVLATGGAYVPLRDFDASHPIDFGFTIDNRRIVMWAQVRNATVTHFASMYIGLMDPFGTAAEVPYPIYICGCTSRFNAVYSDTDIARMTGLTEVIGRTGSPGPGWLRRVDNEWQEVRNSNGSDGGTPSRSVDQQYMVYPAGLGIDYNVVVNEDSLAGDGDFDWQDIIPATGVPGSDTYKFYGAPGTTPTYELEQATVFSTDTTEAEWEMKGELNGVYWVSVAPGGIERDTALIGSERYTIIPNGNRKFDWTYMAIRQS